MLQNVCNRFVITYFRSSCISWELMNTCTGVEGLYFFFRQLFWELLLIFLLNDPLYPYIVQIKFNCATKYYDNQIPTAGYSLSFSPSLFRCSLCLLHAFCPDQISTCCYSNTPHHNLLLHISFVSIFTLIISNWFFTTSYLSSDLLLNYSW